MSGIYNPPPNWPTPPPGWSPPPGWEPDAAWDPPPAEWQLWLPANPDAGRQAAVAGTVVGAVWLLLLLLTGDLSWDDIPRLIGFTALPAAVVYLRARGASRRWTMWHYVWLSLGLSLVVFLVAPFIEVALTR